MTEYTLIICHKGNFCSTDLEAMCPECYCEIMEMENDYSE